MKIFLGFVVAVAVTVATGNSFAQTYYKCKTASGGTAYSDSPCATGEKQETRAFTNSPQPVIAATERGNLAVQLDAKIAEAIGLGNSDKARNLAAEKNNKAPPSAVGRTQADLRAEARNSQECKDAERSYDSEASMSRKYADMINDAKRRMYSACGMEYGLTKVKASR